MLCNPQFIRYSILQFDDAAVDGSGGGFGAVRNFEFLNDAFDVIANGVAADAESAADLLIGESAGKHFENLELACSEIRSHHALGQPGSDVAREVALASMNGPDRFDHVRLRRILQKIALRTGLNRAVNVLVRLIAGEDNGTGMISGALESMQGIDPAHARHAQIKQQQICMFDLQHLHGVFAAGRRAENLHAGLCAKHTGEARQDYRVVIYDKNPNGCALNVGHKFHVPLHTSTRVLAKKSM